MKAFHGYIMEEWVGFFSTWSILLMQPYAVKEGNRLTQREDLPKLLHPMWTLLRKVQDTLMVRSDEAVDSVAAEVCSGLTLPQDLPVNRLLGQRPAPSM